MVANARTDDREPISPELVLVSGVEEARRARERLPEHTEWKSQPPPRPTRASEAARAAAATAAAGRVAASLDASERVAQRDRALPPSYPRVRLDDVPSAPASRRRAPKRALLLVGAVAVLGIAGFLAAKQLEKPHPSTASGIQKSPQTLGAPPPVASPGFGSSPQTASSARAAFIPRGSFLATRIFRWSAQPGVRGYDVRFFWNGRVVLSKDPSKPSLTLPRDFRFHAGRYRWIVRSLPTRPIATPVVDSTFVLTKVAAAAANRR
jgi:hypothetical protein